jgi:hypothetical protein
MKFNIILISLCLVIFSCKKKNNECLDKELIRDYKTQTYDQNIFIITEKSDTILKNYKYIYDFISINYCNSKLNHYVFQSDKKYILKINQDIKMKKCYKIKILKYKTELINNVLKPKLDANNKPILIPDSIQICEIDTII